MATSRQMAIAGLAGASALLATPPALAAWLTSGSGSATAASTLLGAPGTPALQSATTSSLSIGWSAAAAPGTGSVGYHVERAPYSTSPSTATWSDACQTTDAAPVTDTACTDSGLSASTGYMYRVISIFAKWRQQSAVSNQMTTSAAAAATKFALGIPTSATAGSPFNATLTAQKSDGSTDTSYTGSHSLSWSGSAFVNSPNTTAPSAPSTASFANGTVTVQLTLTAALSGTLTVTSGGLSGGSASINVAAAQTTLGFIGSSRQDSNCAAGGTLQLGAGNKSYTAYAARGVDAYGNAAPTTAAVSVTATNATPTTLNIAVGASQTSSTMSASLPSQTTSVIVTISASGFASATCTLTH